MFNPDNLSWSDYYGFFPQRIFSYTTSDNLSDIGLNSYYFNPGYQFRKSDIVEVTANDGKAVYVIVFDNPGENGIYAHKIADGVTSFT